LGEREEEAAFWADLSFQARDHKNRTCCERESEEAAFQTDQTFQLAQLEDRQTDRQTDRCRNARAQSLEEGMAAQLDSTWDFGLIAFKR